MRFLTLLEAALNRLLSATIISVTCRLRAISPRSSKVISSGKGSFTEDDEGTLTGQEDEPQVIVSFFAELWVGRAHRSTACEQAIQRLAVQL